MNNIIIGNIIAFIGSTLMVYCGIIKDKKKVLYYQTIQICLLVISNLVLGGITGAITNIISCVRNILCYKEKLNTVKKVIIIIASMCFTIPFNNLGIIGLLPTITIVIYTIFMDIKDDKKFKILLMFTMITWFIYDVYIKSYTSAVFDFASVIACIIAIYRLSKKSVSKKVL